MATIPKVLDGATFPALRITLACVSEAREPFISETIDLFKTLRCLGGSISACPGIACFVGPVSGDIAERLARLGVQIYIVDPFDTRCPHANKLQMIGPQPDSDYLIALDTDIAIAGDFSLHIAGDSIMAKVVDHDVLSLELWVRLFEKFGIPLPQVRFQTSFYNAETIPYFNSGVIFIPNHLSAVLGAAWSKATLKLLDCYAELPEIAEHRFFTDQFAFSLALHAANLPYRALPIELNFPTHAALHRSVNPDTVSPLLVHYHHRRTANGEIRHCAYEGPNKAIDRINAVLRSTDSQEPPSLSETRGIGAIFDNRDFWEQRYIGNPALGSGIGSRGELAVYKRRVIQEFIDNTHSGSILDIGCGDLEVMKKVIFHGTYHGIDISPTIVERNRISYPGKSFTCANIMAVEDVNPFKADAVLCFDVLIHQHRYEEYQCLVRQLMRAAEKWGLISGYVTRPRPGFCSDITCYHEPLTTTLRKYGACDIKIVGAYRDTSIVEFSCRR